MVTVPLLEPHPMSQIGTPAVHSQLSSPRSVRDLGGDYTRYFSPYASNNNSQQDVSRVYSPYILAEALEGISPEELSRRLSNPFGDTKRMSNPFTSAEDTAPPSPASFSSGMHDALISTIPTAVPAADPTLSMARDIDEEKGDFFQYLDDRLCAPGYSFPLVGDAKEDDDDMHMPQWDDDIRWKPHWRDHFTRENIVSTFGLIFMISGLLCIFVVLPVVSYTGTSILDNQYETPLDQMPGHEPPADPWAHVNDRVYPFLQNIRHGLIDRDTPESAKTRTSIDGEELVLVFSDEFNKQNRTFYEGDDPYWYAFNGWYGATQDLEWYDPDAVNTGKLVSSLESRR